MARRATRASRSPRSKWPLALAALVLCGLVAHALWSLPSSDEVAALARARPKSTALIDARAREAAQAHRPFHRRQVWTPLEQVAPELVACVLASEDARFFEHDGVDLHQMRAALGRDLRAHRWARGASTLTQQLAKNLWLSESKSLSRKLAELVLAERLEQALTKPRILELYLNEAEWGEGIFGIGAASRAWFDESPRELTLAQSAILAAMLPAPRSLSPRKDPQALLPRARRVLERVGEEHLASPEAMTRARDELERTFGGVSQG